MPPVTTDKPDSLKPYLSHGLTLNWSRGDKEAIGDCPWCNKEGKFSVNLTSSLWRCFSCNEGTENGELIKGGNALTFLRKLHEVSYNATSIDDYKTLTQERKLLYPETFVEWQLAKSILTDKWILPGYNIEGSMTGLYRYLNNGERSIWFPTPTMGHHLFGMNLYSPSKPDIYVMEGLWDGAALWETFVALKETEAGYIPTANREVSLSATRNVVAIPTCSVFYEHWLPLFSDKRVILGLDNDHPRKNEKTGAQIPSGAMENTKRIARMMAEYESPPAEINFISWGQPEGYNLELPHKLDTRDVLTSTERIL